ncbi:MAG: ribonuclease T2 family protein [Candidatus Omnitrophota bacterium]
MLFKRILIITLICVFLPVTGAASIKMSGHFTANDTCPALSSIKTGSNPGNIMLTKGTVYDVIGANKTNPTYYQIRVQGANPAERWVAVTCGNLDTNGSGNSSKKPVDPGDAPEYVFAVSWQPAFCEFHSDKTECQNEDPNAFQATHFTLHGLWPQPRSNCYCGVSSNIQQLDNNGAWCQMPQIPNLSTDTLNALTIVMPGVLSCLQNHEWYKHGVCYGEPADTYFTEAMNLLAQLNNSAVQQFFKDNIGKTVSCQDIQNKFDEAFGTGTSLKIKISSTTKNGQNWVTEIDMNLKGTINLDTALGDLFKNADNYNSSCSTVYIDPIGNNN